MSDKARWKDHGQHSRGPGRGRHDTVPNSARSQRRSSAINSLSGYRVPDCWELKQKSLLLLIAAPLMAWGQIPPPQTPAPNNLSIKSPISPNIQLAQRAVYADGYSKNQMTHETISKPAAVSTHSMGCTNSPLPISSSSPPSDDCDGECKKRLRQLSYS
jgi:hypothetical protein